MDSQLPIDFPPMFLFILAGLAIFLSLIATAVHVLIYCKIFSKAGYSWALGLLILVPLVNIIVPFYLAFADWPAQKELRDLKRRLGVAG